MRSLLGGFILARLPPDLIHLCLEFLMADWWKQNALINYLLRQLQVSASLLHKTPKQGERLIEDTLTAWNRYVLPKNVRTSLATMLVSIISPPFREKWAYHPDRQLEACVWRCFVTHSDFYKYVKRHDITSLQSLLKSGHGTTTIIISEEEMQLAIEHNHRHISLKMLETLINLFPEHIDLLCASRLWYNGKQLRRLLERRHDGLHSSNSSNGDNGNSESETCCRLRWRVEKFPLYGPSRTPDLLTKVSLQAETSDRLL